MIERERLDRLDDYLAANELGAVWFARPNSFAWLTGGSNVIDREADLGVAAAGYDGDRLTVVTDTIEADRLRDEELPEDVTLDVFEWYEESLTAAVTARSPTPAAADFPADGFETVDASTLRQPLTASDVEAYRTLGRETAGAVEAVCRELQRDDTEHEVASALRVALSARGIEAPVVLVAGADRASRYRHYTPKRTELGGYALVSVTAERAGLHASLTRTVAFDPPAWLADRHEAAMRVEATALATTRALAGRGTAGDVFESIRDAYAAVGHPDEWRDHHQGGAAGYAGREWIATPALDRAVDVPMAYAWNPTIDGAKSEDTVLVTEDGFEVLTATGDWPTRSVTAVDSEVELERHAIGPQ